MYSQRFHATLSPFTRLKLDHFFNRVENLEFLHKFVDIFIHLDVYTIHSENGIEVSFQIAANLIALIISF